MKPAAVRLAAVVVLSVLAFAPADAQEKRLRTFVDALEQPVLADPRLSPDGRQIAFVIERADWKANRRIGHIFRINIDGTNQVQLTFGERGESESTLVAGQQVDRIRGASRWRHQQPDLSAACRRRRSAQSDYAPDGGRQHGMGAGRHVDLLHRVGRQISRRA